MGKTTIFLMVLCAAISVSAQTTGASQSSNANQQQRKKSKDEVTVKGCLSKLSSDYILTQPDQGNSYELQGSRKMRLGPYLGQEVEVTGVESPSMSTSSDYLTKTGAASPVTINVKSIKTISKRCSN
jgi:hypothetical protein